MSTQRLSRISQPESVVMIGASIRENSVGRTVMKNLASGGFEGRIFHVNPQRDAEGGGPSIFPGLQKLPENIDLAVIATPFESVPDVLEICSEKKMGGVQ